MEIGPFLVKSFKEILQTHEETGSKAALLLFYRKFLTDQKFDAVIFPLIWETYRTA